MEKLSCEELIEELDRLERGIQELIDYKIEMRLHKQSVKGWKRFVADLKMIYTRRQIDRHLVYYKLQRRIAQNCYDRLQKNLQDAEGGKPLV